MNRSNSINFTPTGFFYNGMLSSFSALALRFAGMAFNVYLSSRAGAQAMGLLSLIYSVWGFVTTAGCAGGSLAAARMCAESKSRGESILTACRKCLNYTFICAATVGTVFFLAAGRISLLLSDLRTALPLRILSLSLPFISMSGALSGYFDACARSYKNAVCRIFEQCFRILITVLIFTKLRHADAAAYCTAIIAGGVCADIFSYLLQYVLYLSDRKKFVFEGTECTVTLSGIAKIALPVCISASIRSGLVSLEHMLIPKGLCTFGYTHEDALSLFGTVHGMAIPVILFCISVPSAFSALLIPRFAERNAISDNTEIRYIASRAYRTALIFSFGVSSYLTLSSLMLGECLYPGTDASKYIYVFAPLIPIMYIDSVSDAVLKGTGEQLYSMKINIADAVISVVCVFLLVPRLGISGYIAAIYLSETFNTCASFVRVIKKTGYRLPVIRFVIFPLMLSVVSANVVSLFYKRTAFLSDSVLLISGGVIYAAVFAFLLVFTKNLTEEELSYFSRMLIVRRKRNKG